MKIHLDELERAMKIIFNKFRKEGIDDFELNSDFYYHLESSVMYNILEKVKPEDITIGQISEDYEFLFSMLSNPEDVVRYRLVWLASILKAIGE